MNPENPKHHKKTSETAKEITAQQRAAESESLAAESESLIDLAAIETEKTEVKGVMSKTMRSLKYFGEGAEIAPNEDKSTSVLSHFGNLPSEIEYLGDHCDKIEFNQLSELSESLDRARVVAEEKQKENPENYNMRYRGAHLSTLSSQIKSLSERVQQRIVGESDDMITIASETKEEINTGNIRAKNGPDGIAIFKTREDLTPTAELFNLKNELEHTKRIFESLDYCADTSNKNINKDWREIIITKDASNSLDIITDARDNIRRNNKATDLSEINLNEDDIKKMQRTVDAITQLDREKPYKDMLILRNLLQEMKRSVEDKNRSIENKNPQKK